ncbi:MAG: lipoyl(octanoyl) transferase LipB [Actinobacteria bacterium]|nr:lipoyl(octanoyl) transferase LipB [Actinomycetota bacterium]
MSINDDAQPAVLTASWMGTVDYADAWAWQRELFMARLDGDRSDTLMLLEHPPTYTLGRRGIEEDLVYDEAERARRGIGLYNVDRGGRATYHGPGQLVGYPILELGSRDSQIDISSPADPRIPRERYDVLTYLRKLEEVVIRTAAAFGVDAVRDPENTGVWVGPNKLGAIGVKITRGITMHGFALNVVTDLSMFEGIVPCGIQGRWVTSIAQETGIRHPVKQVASVAAENLAEVFDRPLVWSHPDHLRARRPEITADGSVQGEPSPIDDGGRVV